MVANTSFELLGVRIASKILPVALVKKGIDMLI